MLVKIQFDSVNILWKKRKLHETISVPSKTFFYNLSYKTLDSMTIKDIEKS